MKRHKEFLSGHISIGNLTIYGRNAMHWGCTLYTKKYGYVCFRLPFTDHKHWYPLYLYFSPNGTPWAATFMIGRKAFPSDWVKSRVRYNCFGHNFSIDELHSTYGIKNYSILRAINEIVDGSYYFKNYAVTMGLDKDDDEEPNGSKTF